MPDANPSLGNWSSQRNSVIPGPGHLNKDWGVIHMGSVHLWGGGTGGMAIVWEKKETTLSESDTASGRLL